MWLTLYEIKKLLFLSEKTGVFYFELRMIHEILENLSDLGEERHHIITNRRTVSESSEAIFFTRILLFDPVASSYR